MSARYVARATDTITAAATEVRPISSFRILVTVMMMPPPTLMCQRDLKAVGHLHTLGHDVGDDLDVRASRRHVFIENLFLVRTLHQN